MGIHEPLIVDDAMRDLILGRPSTDELRQAREKRGYPSLYSDGIEKVKQGLTTVEEVTRAIATEG